MGRAAKGLRTPERIGVDEKAAAKGHTYSTLVAEFGSGGCASADSGSRRGMVGRTGSEAGNKGGRTDEREVEEMVKESLGSFPFRAVVETGAFRGTRIAFLHGVSGLPVHSIEVNRYCYCFCPRRFRHWTASANEAGPSAPTVSWAYGPVRVAHDWSLLDA